MAEAPHQSSIRTQRSSQADRSLLVILIFFLSGLLPIALYNLVRHQTIDANSRLQLAALAHGCQSFYEVFNRWPTNFAELHHNAHNRLFFTGALVDHWGRPIVFVVPTDGSAGKVLTYGTDGIPDGDKTDGDCTILIVPPPLEGSSNATPKTNSVRLLKE